MGDDLMGGHDALDGVPDAGEAELAIEEGLDGDFVGGIEHGGEGAADGAGVAGEVDGGEVIDARGLEVEGGELGEVERPQIVRDAVGPGDGVLDGEAHVTVAELGDDAVVSEFDHAVDDALRMDDDLDLVHGHVEEPFGLDHFEPFVEEGGAVDGDLSPHGPGGMLQGLGDGDGGQLIGGELAEGAAAGGEEDAADLAVAVAFQALEDGVVLAVHGQEVHVFPLGGLRDGLAGHDEDLLAGDGEVHATLDGGEGGGEPGGADDGDEDHVGLASVHEVDEALGAGVKGDAVRELRLRFGRRGGIGEGDVLHAGLDGLLDEGIRAAVRGEADDLHALGEVTGHFEGAGADGTGGAEKDDAFGGHAGEAGSEGLRA